MAVLIYSGDCRHTGKKPDDLKNFGYGTSFCPVCQASRGIDGLWRVLVDDPA